MQIRYLIEISNQQDTSIVTGGRLGCMSLQELAAPVGNFAAVTGMAAPDGPEDMSEDEDSGSDNESDEDSD